MRVGWHRWRGTRLAVAAAVAALAVSGLGGTAAAMPAHPAAGAFTVPPIKHVWVIQLENEGFTRTFGDPSADPYLATTLPSMGALLENYYAIGHDSLDNYIAEVTGQAPDHQTQEDCGWWSPFVPGKVVRPPYNQLVGHGCVYPATVPTLGNQLSDAGLSWAAYMQDMGNNPTRDDTTPTAQGPACGHPPVGHRDPTENATPGDQYAARHQGFMYFESVIGNHAFCDEHILSFRPLLHDLKFANRTPAYSWLSPNLCNDGHDAPCANGDPGGLTQIDSFLEAWVPIILDSPAYRQGGLLMITFDEGDGAAACCGETRGRTPSHPNSPEPGFRGPGGGRVGAVLLSPFITPGTVSTVKYNHYSMLRSIEDIFGVGHLGDAAMPQVRSFGADVYTNAG